MQRPNEQRNFVHKRIFGAAKGFLTGGVTGAIGGAIRGGSSRRGGQPVAQIHLAPVNVQCPPGSSRNAQGRCQTNRRGPIGALQRFLPLGATGLVAGDPRFGSASGGAYLPDVEVSQVRHCLPGDVLGRDGFCYAKNAIANKDRQWPRGRRPLGTPGEMAALAKAASFGRRMETTVKRMQKIGVLKKPAKRIAPRKPLQITSAAQHHAGG